MKIVSVVLPENLIEIVKKIGKQNERHFSQEVRLALTNLYMKEVRQQ